MPSAGQSKGYRLIYYDYPQNHPKHDCVWSDCHGQRGRPWPRERVRERFMRMSCGHSKVSSILRDLRDILSVAITAFIFIVGNFADR